MYTARTWRNRSWRDPAGRDSLAVGLTAAVLGFAVLAFVDPKVPDDTLSQVSWWRLTAATAIVYAVIGAVLARVGRPGLAYPVLVFSSAMVAAPIEQAWWASRSLAYSSEIPSGHPDFALIFVAVLARTAIPAGILALYASAPERRLGRWVSPVVWLITVVMLVTAGFRVIFEMNTSPSDIVWWDAGQLDQAMPVSIVAGLGLLGSLRSAARRELPVPAREPTSAGPTRAIVTAVVAIVSIWPAATYVFLNRPYVADWDEDTISRLVALPILLALVGFVAARWSKVLAWAALAGAFQTNAILIFYRGVSEYFVAALANGPDIFTPAPAIFLVMTAVGVLVQLLAFSATGIAVLAVLKADSAGESRERSWAIGGAFAGFAFCAWYLGGSVATGSALYAGEVLLAPAYPFLPLVLALGAWRRLVPAVAEAEATAVRPLRPLRYLETVVSETLTARAGQRRGAVEAERARLASELHAEFLPNLERLATKHAAGATREEVTERLQALQDEVRRLMAERRLVILEEFGIVEALEWLVAQAEDRVSFAVELTVDDGSTTGRPPRDVERAAFRVAQLAVENAIQHARPTHLALRVLARQDRLTVSVADDGRWAPSAQTDRRRDHVGMADMRSAANNVRGAVEVVASQGGGTTVQFAWPALGSAG